MLTSLEKRGLVDLILLLPRPFWFVGVGLAMSAWLQGSLSLPTSDPHPHMLSTSHLRVRCYFPSPPSCSRLLFLSFSRAQRPACCPAAPNAALLSFEALLGIPLPNGCPVSCLT